MQSRLVLACTLAFALVATTFPASTAVPLVDLALGSPLVSDFEDGEQGWTASPPGAPWRPAGVSTWEWGTPTSGPGVAASGSKVWATNLSGNYLTRECGAIVSPPIDLSSAATAGVSFKQWRHMEESTSATSFAFDAGLLYVTSDGGLTLTKVTPAGGYTSKKIGSTSRGCLDGAPDPTFGLSGPAGTTVPPPTYSTVSTDLSAFAGSTVQFVIAFASDSSTQRAGWFIDDFAVTVDGVTTVEDFEASDGGFTLQSTYALIVPQGFSHGVPTVGPGSSSPMFATNPTGNYASGECSWLESPTFRLGDVADPGAGVLKATLSWNHWFRSNSLYSAGIVQIGVHEGDSIVYSQITPTTGYTGKVDGTYASQLMGCLGVELNTSSFEGTTHSEGAPMQSYKADLSAYVGKEVSIRFFFTSAWSNLNPTLYSGWYIDDVAVDLSLVVDGPDVEEIIGEVAADPSRMDAPLWTSGGAHSTWAWGVASVGPVGEVAYGTNLTGTHHGDECSFAESPEIPAAGLAVDPTLSFEHWYNIYPASTSGAAWSGAAVFVSTDSGATWKYLDLPEYDLEARYTDTRACLKSFDPTIPALSPRVFSGNNSAWESVNVDLSAFAGATTIKVRFVFSSGISIYRDGYYLRSAELGGVKIL